VVLTAFAPIGGRGTGIAVAAASGSSSSSGAAWKYASAIVASLSALAVMVDVDVQGLVHSEHERAIPLPFLTRHIRAVLMALCNRL
jgi:hypothetical protein